MDKNKNKLLYKVTKIKDQFLGGIKDQHNQHPGSAGILIFFRWYLLHNLVKSDIVSEYDRFVITRSDFIYQLPHPKMDILDPNLIWIPNSEYKCTDAEYNVHFEQFFTSRS